jgi:hypothetical protein
MMTRADLKIDTVVERYSFINLLAIIYYDVLRKTTMGRPKNGCFPGLFMIYLTTLSVT